MCQIRNQEIGLGIYVYDKIRYIETLDDFSKIFMNSKNYYVLFQCRCNPATVKKVNDDVWVIAEARDIRPYRIIYMEC